MISDNYELPEDVAEKMLLGINPPLEKGDTYRNMESVAITVQNTERDMYQYGTDRISQSIRSDRNEDTMRPL
jgi:hypothetical protein